MEVVKFVINENDVYIKDAEARSEIESQSESLSTAQSEIDSEALAISELESEVDSQSVAYSEMFSEVDEDITEIGTTTEESNTDVISLASGDFTIVESITLPAGTYIINSLARVDNSYTGAVVAGLGTSGVSDISVQASTATDRATIVNFNKHITLAQTTTLNLYVMVYASGYTNIKAAITATKI